MIPQRHLFLIVGALLFFSSCVTSFETGQEAATLSVKNLAVGADLGAMKMAANIRYGLFNKLDLGVSCNFNFPDADKNGAVFPEFSTDCKWQFIGTPDKHFVIATGVGFGTGVERTTLWNEIYSPSEDEAWYNYGGISFDGYLPLYFSYYLREKNSFWSFNCNPYIVYRFGFNDEYTGLGPGDDFTGYQTLNQVFGGTAFSMGVGGAKNSLLGVINLLYPGPHSPNALDAFEIYIAYSHKFNLARKKVKQ